MTIPLATTTIAVYRPADGDPYDTSSGLTLSASGVRAQFSSPGGSDAIVDGERVSVDMRLDCDVCDIGYQDRITDESTNEEWDVVWARLRAGLALDHIEAGVRRVQGSVMV